MSEAKILENDPLSSAESILRDEFYGQNKGTPSQALGESATGLAENSEPAARKPAKAKAKAKPTHYKVVCISLYTQDIENLEATVAELKRRGHTKANKSQLIRQALRQLDIDKLPPPQQ
ncbi:MAG: hypothetical protein GY811_04295 [Myxococcales bacterium]|nr:hypothetical protein [Myxococcales bacterium]